MQTHIESVMCPYRSPRFRPRLSASLVALALGLVADAAYAQDPAPAPPAVNPPADDVIVVTARRREEKLIDVPVAANVISGATLERYATSDFIQLQTVSPGLQIARTGGGTPGGTVRIRGIGVFGADYSSEQPISIVIDGVPVSRGHIIDIGFFDQASLQVLRGPQALFFGKNSPAGVIASDSVNPGRELEGYARASYGFYTQDPVLEAAITIPLSDTLSIRLAGRGEAMQGGYIRNVGTPQAVNPIPDPIFGGAPAPLPGANYKDYPQTKQALGRVTAVWKPSDNFRVTAKYLYGWTHYRGAYSPIAFNCGAERPTYQAQLTGQRYISPDGNCGFHFETNSSTPPAAILDNFLYAPDNGKYYRSSHQGLASVTADLRLNDINVTSTTGYYHVNTSQFDNFDQTTFAETPTFQSEKTGTITEEVRVSTDYDTPLNLTFGAFYEHENRRMMNTNRIFTLGLLPAGLPDQQQYAGASNTLINLDHNYTDTYSAFGQATWKITSTIELAGGVRYTKSNKKSDLNVLLQALDQLFIAAPGGAEAASSLAPAGTRYDLKVNYDNWSPEITLSWKPAPNMLVYGAFKTGFLAGGIANPGTLSNYSARRGFSQAQRTDILAFDPETTKGFELGLKGDFFDGKLTSDLTFFRYKFKGLQIATLNPSTATFTVGNAASAIDKGVELNSTLHVAEGLTLRASVAYVSLKFDGYDTAPCYPGQALTASPGCQVNPADPRGRSQDLSGTRFGTAPVSTNVGFTYTSQLTDKYKMTLSSDVQSYTKSPELNRQPSSRIPGYSVVNASLRLDQSNGPWAVSLIGSNLFDKVYVNTVSNKPLGNPQDLLGYAGPGREVRLQIDRTF